MRIFGRFRWRCVSISTSNGHLMSTRVFVFVTALVSFLVGMLSMYIGMGIYVRDEVIHGDIAPPQLSPQFNGMVQLNSLPHQRKFAIVTLATQRQYLLPSYALGMSLRATRTMWPLIALLSQELAHDNDVLQNLTIAGYNFIHVVDRIDNPARALDPIVVKKETGRSIQPHKMDVFTKFRIFQLTAFDRILFLDADTVVVENVDHLLMQEQPYGVVPSLAHQKECKDQFGQQFSFT